MYAYIRIKQNVRDKVGLLEDSAGNIISQGFLMTEDLNGYFGSVFTTEDSSSLPVPDAKFQEVISDYLVQLIVTPEMVAKKIKAMNDNNIKRFASFHSKEPLPLLMTSWTLLKVVD